MSSATMSPIRFPHGVLDDVASLSESEQNRFVDFLHQLQVNPHDPEILRGAEKKDRYYAVRLNDLVVYWTLDSAGNPEDKPVIDVLKIVRAQDIQ
jgi:mRNA-degrading endonuclease RelE of RelBE toxin-antitoxin system